jgi:hypothetical protein
MLGVGNKKIIIAAILFFSFSFLVLGQAIPDQELKKNIMPVQNALASVQQLKPKKYEYNTEKYAALKLSQGQQYGFLAEDVQKVLPNLISSESRSVMVGKNTYQNKTIQTTDMESLIPLLVAAIQEQQKQIEDLKQQVEAQQK